MNAGAGRSYEIELATATVPPVRLEATGTQLAALDKLVFEPRRFAVLNLLSGGAEADYPLLQRVTDVSMGALASHLHRMEGAGLLAVHKEFAGKRPRTFVSITPQGSRAIGEAWRTLDEARAVCRIRSKDDSMLTGGSR